MFRNGGSSGGVDVFALIMEKYFNVKPSNTVMVIDALTVIAGLYIYGLNSVLIGLLSVYLLSFSMERTISMYRGIEGKKFEIILHLAVRTTVFFRMLIILMHSRLWTSSSPLRAAIRIRREKC